MKNSNKIISNSWICPVVDVEDGDIAFELNDDLMDQFNLKSGDTVVFKNTLKDRYSMVIIRNNNE